MIAEASVEAHEEERDLLLTLTARMIQDGKAEDILRLQNDKEFLSSIINKYNL